MEKSEERDSTDVSGITQSHNSARGQGKGKGKGKGKVKGKEMEGTRKEGLQGFKPDPKKVLQQ